MRPFALTFLLVAACASQGAAPEAPKSACRSERFEGSSFTVCDPGRGKIEIVAAARGEMPLRRFVDLEQRLGKQAKSVAFAMNAGMFDEEGRPIGLAIVDGREVHGVNRRNGGGNFHLMPNGVFELREDGRAAIVPTTAWKPSADIAFATQSGPMLVIAGKLHPKFERDGMSQNIRNAVGIASDGRARFVISDDLVSFGKLARLFRDRLGCRDALFFDGSVSALWDPANGRRDLTVPLGPLVVAFKHAGSAPDRAGHAKP